MMSGSSDSFESLNPDIYLNHLSPPEATEFEICRNISLAIFGATIWDILVYIPDDIKIVRRSRFGPVIFCFIFSRLFATGYVLSGVIRRIMPIDNPRSPTLVAGVFCLLAVGCSSYLFLRRVHVVYADNKRVQWISSALWVVYIASEISIPLGVKPSFIPGTHYYKDSGIRPIVALSVLVGTLFDSFVFLAISYKIASAHSLSDKGIGWDSLISGKALPRLSRAVLQGGQQYYLMTVGMMILVGILLYLPSVHQIPKAVIAMPLVPFVASMACRVFRNIKLHDFHVSTIEPVSAIRSV